jgi:hypothetical protein
MEEHLLDVRDIDTEWFLGVTAYLDRGNDLWHFPKDAVERLGEPDADGSGSYWLLDGRVEAVANEVGVDGTLRRVWTVPVKQVVTRPAQS